MGAGSAKSCDWVARSGMLVTGTSGKVVRSSSLSWKQPSKAMASVAFRVAGPCGEEGGTCGAQQLVLTDPQAVPSTGTRAV